MKAWRLALGGVVAGAALAIAGVFAFQDNLTRYLGNPRAPFQTVAPPPAPQYGARGAWILWPDQRDARPADIFYVHSTTYYSSEGWNGSINDDVSDTTLKRIAAPNEAGPFLGAGRIFGPRYRQATLYAFFTHKFDGVAARKFAYQDVARAFAKFLESVEEDRPIVLVGYGQGGLHVLGLLKDFFQNDEELQKRLAVAYVIGQAAPMPHFETTLAKTPPCYSPQDVRCVVSYTDLEPQFDEEAERTRERSMVWSREGELEATSGAPILCVNPLTWTVTGEYVGPERHRGAASATGLQFGETPPAISRAVGAQCVNGVLQVDRPVQEFLRRDAWFGAKWRAQHFNLFYYDLSADVRRRLSVLAELREREYRHLDPIDQSLDLEVSPVNKVPDP